MNIHSFPIRCAVFLGTYFTKSTAIIERNWRFFTETFIKILLWPSKWRILITWFAEEVMTSYQESSKVICYTPDRIPLILSFYHRLVYYFFQKRKGGIWLNEASSTYHVWWPENSTRQFSVYKWFPGSPCGHAVIRQSSARFGVFDQSESGCPDVYGQVRQGECANAQCLPNIVKIMSIMMDSVILSMACLLKIYCKTWNIGDTCYVRAFTRHTFDRE